MIRRALCWLADWLSDSQWLREMHRAEVMANRSAARHERWAARTGNVIEDALFPPTPERSDR